MIKEDKLGFVNQNKDVIYQIDVEVESFEQLEMNDQTDIETLENKIDKLYWVLEMKRIKVIIDGNNDESIEYGQFIMSNHKVRLDNLIIKDLDMDQNQEIIDLIKRLKNNNPQINIDYVQEQKTDIFINNQIKLDWYSVINIPSKNGKLIEMNADQLQYQLFNRIEYWINSYSIDRLTRLSENAQKFGHQVEDVRLCIQEMINIDDMVSLVKSIQEYHHPLSQVYIWFNSSLFRNRMIDQMDQVNRRIE